MAAATLTNARALVFRLAPEEQIEIAQAIVQRANHLPTSKKAGSKVAVSQEVSRLTRAIGSPLTGGDLDERLEKAIQGQEKSISATQAIQSARKRVKNSNV